MQQNWELSVRIVYEKLILFWKRWDIVKNFLSESLINFFQNLLSIPLQIFLLFYFKHFFFNFSFKFHHHGSQNFLFYFFTDDRAPQCVVTNLCGVLCGVVVAESDMRALIPHVHVTVPLFWPITNCWCKLTWKCIIILLQFGF